MASLPNQDPSSPGAVAGATFPTVRKGFDPAVVREFLRQVSQELGRAQHERDRVARELDEAREAIRRAAPEHMDEATVAAKLGEEAARVLATAHEAARQIRAKAEDAAAQTLRDAELDAARQRGDAEVEAARRRRESEEQADAEVEGAKLEGREMVAEAREVRERIFSDLTQRRERARQQIEALQAGRQRIMASFLGARGDLDAILAELEALAAPEAEEDEPDLPDTRPPDTGPTPVTPATVTSGTGTPGPGMFLGEMDVPASIVSRLIESAVEPAVADEDQPDEDALDEDALDEDALDEEDEPEQRAEEVPGAEIQTGELDEVEDLEVEEGDVEVEAAGATTDEVLVTEAEPPADSPGVPAPDPVEDLFARLRASSSETVARDVLEPEPDVASAQESGPAEPMDRRADALAYRKAVLAPVRTALARHLKRVLADEQNEVLDRLRQRNASLEVDDVLGLPDQQAGTYREAAEDHLWAAAEHGAHALSALEGEELHAALEARSVLDRCLDNVAAELVAPLRARVTENLAASADGTEAAGFVRGTYREWKGRIDELCEDLVRTAYGRASYAVLERGVPICWVLDPSGPGCADAEDNVLAGPVPAGEPFPTGHRYAPAYRGCRCLLMADPG